MKKLRILILQGDKDHGRALGICMANLNPDFDVTIGDGDRLNDFTQCEKEDYIKKFDIILLDKGFSDPRPHFLMDPEKIVCLCTEDEFECFKSDNDSGAYEMALFSKYKRDGPGVFSISQNSEEDENQLNDRKSIPCLYKFIDVEEMSSAIRFFHGIRGGKYLRAKRLSETRMIIITSASGGMGTTSVAVTLSRLLSQIKKYKVLYLNYEEISSTLVYFHGSSGGKKDLNEYIYQLFKGTAPEGYLESFTLNDDYDVVFFNPSNGRNQLLALNRDELEIFIGSLMDSKAFNYIIIDSFSDLSKSGKYLLERSEKIVLLEVDTALSRHKNDQWMEEFCLLSGSDVDERVIRVENMSEKRGSRNLSYDENSFLKKGAHIEITTTNAFAVCVRSLLEEVCGYG